MLQFWLWGAECGDSVGKVGAEGNGTFVLRRGDPPDAVTRGKLYLRVESFSPEWCYEKLTRRQRNTGKFIQNNLRVPVSLPLRVPISLPLRVPISPPLRVSLNP